ncbi:MAG: geranylgeranyl reductase family protein [Vicinamibacterales bacterium]
MRDVAVIGAGPAGLIAARGLAKAGFDVLVLEEHPTIGVPVHCTGLLGLDAFSELALPRSSILTTTHAATFVAADGSSVLVDAERVRAAIVDRAAFDQALAADSGLAGAEIRSGARVRSIAVDASGVAVRLDAGDETIHARACVLACGANYRFNRQIGLGIPRAFAQSAQLERPFAGPETVEVHLGRRIAPGGFAWVVPFHRGDRRCNRVGLMCNARVATYFRAFTAQARARFDPAGAPWAEPRLKILPLGPVSRTYAHRVIAVGDAAGLVKPTTGGGIYYGLLSGQMAAETLDEALRADDLREARLRRYETQWRARLGPEIRIGLAFRTLAARMSDGAIDALIDLARIDGLVPLLRQTADFNWHRQSALALLRHSQFRRILLGALWD